MNEPENQETRGVLPAASCNRAPIYARKSLVCPRRRLVVSRANSLKASRINRFRASQPSFLIARLPRARRETANTPGKAMPNQGCSALRSTSMASHSNMSSSWFCNAGLGRPNWRPTLETGQCAACLRNMLAARHGTYLPGNRNPVLRQGLIAIGSQSIVLRRCRFRLRFHSVGAVRIGSGAPINGSGRRAGPWRQRPLGRQNSQLGT